MRQTYDSNPDTRSWNCDTWLHALSAASDKVTFEYCPDAYGEPQYTRMDPQLFTFFWKIRMRGKYTSTTQDLRKLQIGGGLIAGGNHAFAARFSSIPQGRASNGTLHKLERPVRDAVYTFDLKIVQDRGLIFFKPAALRIPRAAANCLFPGLNIN